MPPAPDWRRRAPWRRSASSTPARSWRPSRAGPPDAVLALDGSEERLRAGLDPLGLEHGPPVVPVLDVVGPRDPFDAIAARRLRAIVQLHALRDRAAELEGVIAAQAVSRRRELEAAQLDGLRRLALAAEYRDDNTHEHTQRVGHLAALLARASGLGDRMVYLVREAAPLHDLGKIAIPDSILLKPGRLSDEEYEVVKTHALLGARVLTGRRLRAAGGGRADRAPPPRALGRRRLPGRAGRRGHPGRRADRRRRRRVRRARPRAPVQGLLERRGGRGGDPQGRRHAVRPVGGRGVRRARARTAGARTASRASPGLRGVGPSTDHAEGSRDGVLHAHTGARRRQPHRRHAGAARCRAGAGRQGPVHVHAAGAATRHTACTASSIPRTRGRTRPRRRSSSRCRCSRRRPERPSRASIGDPEPLAAIQDAVQRARLRRAHHLDAAQALLALAAARPAAQGGRARPAGDHRHGAGPGGAASEPGTASV